MHCVCSYQSAEERCVFDVWKNAMQYAISGTERISVGKLFHNDGPTTEKPQWRAVHVSILSRCENLEQWDHSALQPLKRYVWGVNQCIWWNRFYCSTMQGCINVQWWPICAVRNLDVQWKNFFPFLHKFFWILIFSVSECAELFTNAL